MFTIGTRLTHAALALLLGVAALLALASLAAAQPPPRGDRPPRPDGQPGPGGGRQAYSIEQAVSDEAQLHTIAFSGLAFLTGDFGAATFLPPGKVCDFFGFQYMRDIDTAEKGHNPMFLDRVAANVLQTLTAAQRSAFEQAAREEAAEWRTLAERRFVLVQAFYRELQGTRPAGTTMLDPDAVARYVGDLFAFDAELSYRRARLFAQVAAAFTPAQQAALAQMRFGDFNTWPAADMEQYKLPRGSEKLVNVAYMTYASEFFSWHKGNVAADTYFCPERHGTYFGGFFMKDMPAMGQRDFDISTSVTGDSGRAFLETLSAEQRGWVTSLVDRQRAALAEIVTVRRAIATELRKFLSGVTPDRATVVALGRRYGELDGRLSAMYATAFARVGRTLTESQRATLVRLRNLDGYLSAPAYIYSDPLRALPAVPASDALFSSPR